MLLRRHRAIARAWEQSTLLPFLYQTRTIVRTFATGPDTIDEVLDSHDALSYHGDQSRHQARPPREFKFIDHVPFEGAGRPGDAHADFQGSTISPRERKVFEKLFKLRQGKDGKKKAGAEEKQKEVTSEAPPKRKGQMLDDIMDAAGNEEAVDLSVQPAYPQGLQRMAREAREQRKRDSKPSQSDAIAAAAKKDMANVKRHLDKAKTDVEVWNVLQEHVFKRVIALNLDAPVGRKSKRPSKNEAPAAEATALQTTAPTALTKSKKGQQQPPISDLDILTLTLPHHLTTTLKTLTTSFPSSPLPLTLLPSLRTLGPTAFALGTSTYLYNQHMLHAFRSHRDLDTVVDTLREMDEAVYEYDEYTEKLIGQVLNHARLAQRGEWGEGVRVLWEGEGMRKRVGRVFWWGKRVRGRREEEALRNARAEEAAKEEGEESGEDE